MNRKGFTLVELLATLAILGIIVGITIVSVSGIFSNTKNKTEDVFVDTIEDAMDVYLDSEQAKNMNFSEYRVDGKKCYLDKTAGLVPLYVANNYFSSVINSEYSPITQDDLVNPSVDKDDENYECNEAENISISVYKDDDYVYYYSIDKSQFGCLKDVDGVISNLPEGVVCY